MTRRRSASRWSRRRKGFALSSWTEQAACAGDDPQRYVLDSGPHKAPPASWHRIAHQLCQDCPVRPECADDALTHGDVGVVRGGVWLSPRPGLIHPTSTAKRHLSAVANERRF